MSEPTKCPWRWCVNGINTKPGPGQGAPCAICAACNCGAIIPPGSGECEACRRELRGISDDERQWLAHMQRWGSDGYPIRKVRSGWIWNDAFGVKGAPIVYKRKRDCIEAIERFRAVLLDANAGRI